MGSSRSECGTAVQVKGSKSLRRSWKSEVARNLESVVGRILSEIAFTQEKYVGTLRKSSKVRITKCC